MVTWFKSICRHFSVVVVVVVVSRRCRRPLSVRPSRRRRRPSVVVRRRPSSSVVVRPLSVRPVVRQNITCKTSRSIRTANK